MDTAESLRDEALAADRGGDLGTAIFLFNRILREHPASAVAAEARQYLDSRRPAGGHVASGVAPHEPVQLVRVVDVDVKFTSMVRLFVKAAIAAIPAAIIIAIIYAGALAFLGILANSR